MSTDSFSESPRTAHASPSHSLHARAVPADTVPDEAHSGDVNRELIQETRDQIRALVDEIASLAQSSCSRTEFYQGFLTRTTSALASIGGAIWIRDPGGTGLSLEYQVNLKQTGLAGDPQAQARHGQLLERVAAAGQPMLVPPGSGTAQVQDNPTEQLLVIAPLFTEQEVTGLVEIFQRPGAGPTTQRGYLRFLVQMSKVASDFLRSDQLRRFSRQQHMWSRLQTFIRAIHGSLNVRQTVYAIANEGRAVMDCERLSVAIRRGGRLEVLAMSGLDSIERRAGQVKSLGRLVTTVVRAGQPMWYSGDDSGLPPQIENQLHQYLDVSHSRMVAIQPLHRLQHDRHRSGGDENTRTSGPVIGALIVEQTADARPAAGLRERLQTVTSHAEDALTNSLDHSEMFLAPLWTWLGKTLIVQASRNLPRLAIGLLVLSGLLASLWMIPASFTLQSSGRLVPGQQTEIYAQTDGVLQELRIPEDPAQVVQQGDVLAVMSNNQLLVEIRNLQGQLGEVEEKAKKLQRALTRQSGLSVIDRGIIEGDLTESHQLQSSLARQLQLKMDELEMLNIRAPSSGQVVNWQLRQNLLRRPVQRGQNLMTIVPPDTPWQIELEFPERRIAHLTRAVRETDQPLTVTLTLASHPGAEYRGQLVSIDNKLDVRGDDGNAVLLRVALDASQLPRDLLRSGTRVTAQVHAGQRSLGYVWFHELFESLQATWRLWL